MLQLCPGICILKQMSLTLLSYEYKTLPKLLYKTLKGVFNVKHNNLLGGYFQKIYIFTSTCR